MKTFDLFLVTPGDHPVDVGQLRDGLAAVPHLHQDAKDPGRFVYYNPESGTVFYLLVDEQYLPEPPRKEQEEEEEEEELLDEDADLASEAESSVEDPGDDEEDAGDHGAVDESPPIDVPPLTASIPLFYPSFVAREALEVVTALREHASLAVIDPQEGGAGGGDAGDWRVDELFTSWLAAHPPAFAQLDDKERDRIEKWPRERAERFGAYCRHRERLARELEAAGLHVPPLFAARHRGETKSLVVWRSDTPAVLPRADLVLLQRPREKRGFFGHRSVVDELVVPGEVIWKILRPFSEERGEPVPLLVFHRAASPPAQVANDIADLDGEPAESARRTELAGIVDFEIPAAAAGTAVSQSGPQA
jgi:hypothetical protein